MNTPERKNAQSKQRRQFTPSQKAAIVKRHLVDGVAVSALCDEYDLKPTQFYQWQKQLFDLRRQTVWPYCRLGGNNSVSINSTEKTAPFYTARIPRRYN